MKTRKIILLKTAVYKGKHYPPESDHDWPVNIVDELIEKDAAEPVMNVRPDPSVDPQRNDKIIFAVKDILDAAGPGELNQDGSPKVEAVEEILEFDITAEERDQAWEILKKESGDA